LVLQGLLERTVHLSFGDIPGRDYLGQITSDVVIHTWELARAVGADEHLDAALFEQVHASSAPRAEAWRSARPSAPPSTCPPAPTPRPASWR